MFSIELRGPDTGAEGSLHATSAHACASLQHRWPHGSRVIAVHARRITRRDRGGVVTFMNNGCERPSPRGHLTVSLGPQEERDGPEALLCNERRETPDTVVKRTLGSPQASLACPEEPHGQERITLCSASPGSHGAPWHPSSVGMAHTRLGTKQGPSVAAALVACTTLWQHPPPWQWISATKGPLLLGDTRVGVHTSFS